MSKFIFLFSILSVTFLSPSIYAAEWYEGGTLHQATLEEWKNARYKNKTATAADMAINAPAVNKAVQQANSMEMLKIYAVSLALCVDEVASPDVDASHLKVADTAALCASLMGWLK